MSKLDGQWIELFRAGEYGEKGSYTSADLASMAGAYDVNFHHAPVVIGHPETDAPAYGWIDALRASGDVLEGRLGQVDPGFEDLLKQGRFKTRSAALYSDLGGKGLYLRHVGFLGAQPPEVKGLKSIFHDDQSKGFVEIETKSEKRTEETIMEKDELKKTFGEALREWAESVGLVKKPDAENRNAGKTFSEAEVEAAKAEAAKTAAAAAKAEAEKKFSEQSAAAARKAEVETLITKLKAGQQWLPPFDKLKLREFIESLPAEPLTFGEDGKQSAYAVFVKFLEDLPKFIELGKSTGTKGKINPTGDPKFVEGSEDLRDRAQQIATEQKLDFGEALKLARKELKAKAAA